MVKEKEKWVKETCRNGVHPDRFNMRVMNKKMKLENQHRCAALMTAVGALKEWDELALDKTKRKALDKGDYKLEHLLSWEREFYVDNGNEVGWTAMHGFLGFPTDEKSQKGRK
jgi:hypothetical protein